MVFDIIIVGAGKIGLALANRLKHKRVLVLEKESEVAFHQSGRNSNVVHSGIYYRANSLKSELCLKGVPLLKEFCSKHKIPYFETGKVIVAANNAEEHELYRLKNNGVPCELIGKSKLQEREPYVTGYSALLVKSTAITDYRKVCQTLSYYSSICFDCLVKKVKVETDKVVVRTNNGTFEAEQLINCAGVHADELTKISDLKIIPFRGEYYKVKNPTLCNFLIYPVPKPELPFLGVHLHKTVAGNVECGPSAVMAFGKEAYKWWQVNLPETIDFLRFSGVWKLAKQFWKTSLRELATTVSKYAFLKQVQKLVPTVKWSDLSKGKSGIRAQALDKTGKLVDDFYFVNEGERVLHVINCPSPAATACFAIADYIVEKFSL